MNEKLKKILKKIGKVIFIISGVSIILYIFLFIGTIMLISFLLSDPPYTICIEHGYCWDDKHNRCVKNDDDFCIKSEAKCKTNNGIWLNDLKYCKFVKNNN